MVKVIPLPGGFIDIGPQDDIYDHIDISDVNVKRINRSLARIITLHENIVNIGSWDLKPDMGLTVIASLRKRLGCHLCGYTIIELAIRFPIGQRDFKPIGQIVTITCHKP